MLGPARTFLIQLLPWKSWAYICKRFPNLQDFQINGPHRNPAAATAGNSEISIRSPLLAVTAVLLQQLPSISVVVHTGLLATCGLFLVGGGRLVPQDGFGMSLILLPLSEATFSSAWNSLGWDCLFALSMIFQLSGDQAMPWKQCFPQGQCETPRMSQ